MLFLRDDLGNILWLSLVISSSPFRNSICVSSKHAEFESTGIVRSDLCFKKKTQVILGSMSKLDWIIRREARDGNTSFRPSLLVCFYSLTQKIFRSIYNVPGTFWATQIKE